MCQAVILARVRQVKVVARNFDLIGIYFPCALIFLSLPPVLAAPPICAAFELLELHWLGLRVAATSLRECELVKPGFVRGSSFLKKQQVCRDLGIRCEDALRKSDNGVQVALFHQLLLDQCSALASLEEGAIW